MNRLVSHAAVEVHAVDTDARVVFDAQIDVLADPKAKVPRLGEIPFPQFVFLDLQPTLEDFFGLGSAHGDMDGNFLITADAKRADGISCFTYTRRSKGARSMSSRSHYCRLESDH